MPRDVYVLGLIAFTVMVGFGVLIPVLPIFAKSFGIGNFEVGAVISIFAVMRLLGSPLASRLLTRFSERPVLATGMFIVAASSAAAGLAQSYPQLLIFRGVGGLGSAMFSVSAMTLLLRSVSADYRGRAAGFFQGGFLLGGMAGPGLGSLLSTISLTAPFFAYAVTLAVGGSIGLLLLRPPPHQSEAAEPGVPLRQVLRNPGYQAACATSFAQGWSAFGVRTALVPILIVDGLGRTAVDTGIVFAIAAVAQTVALGPAGWFVDTVGRRPAMIIGTLVCAVSIAATPLAPNLGLLILVLVVFGLGSALLGTAPAAAVGDAAGTRAGRPIALYSMLADIGAIAGPLVAGLLADRLSMTAAFTVGAALMLIATLVSLRMAPGVPQRPPAENGAS